MVLDSKPARAIVAVRPEPPLRPSLQEDLASAGSRIGLAGDTAQPRRTRLGRRAGVCRSGLRNIMHLEIACTNQATRNWSW